MNRMRHATHDRRLECRLRSSVFHLSDQIGCGKVRVFVRLVQQEVGNRVQLFRTDLFTGITQHAGSNGANTCLAKRFDQMTKRHQLRTGFGCSMANGMAE